MIEQPTDTRRRTLLTGAVAAVGGVGVLGVATPFVAAWAPSERARAIGAPVDIDFGKLEDGAMMIAEWRGKPVFVLSRTAEQLAAVSASQDSLRDPDSNDDQQPGYAQNEFRSIKPEVLVVIGVCTHLGCSPKKYGVDVAGMGDGWQGGFFCPCHGSKFDLAGRVFKGVPAPTNLEVPPYEFISESIVRIGSESASA